MDYLGGHNVITGFFFFSLLKIYLVLIEGLPCSLSGKESAFNARDLGSIPELGRSPGEGNGTPVFLPGEPQG